MITSIKKKEKRESKQLKETNYIERKRAMSPNKLASQGGQILQKKKNSISRLYKAYIHIQEKLNFKF